jgi:nitroreductase
MDFKDLVHHRESTRRYLDKPVETDKIETILQACRLAPSACNSQPWRFVVATDPVIKLKLAYTTFNRVLQFNRFVPQAPVIAAIIGERPKWFSRLGGAVKGKDFQQMDVGIAAQHFCLQAADLGLGTCMLGWFDEAAARKILGVPSSKRILLLITLGYPANEKNRTKIRKPEQQVWSFNKY